VERFDRLSPAKKRIFLDHLEQLAGGCDETKLRAIIDELEAAFARANSTERTPRGH